MLDLLPLVKRTAQRISDRLPAHVEAGDLVAEGVLGLLDAIGKFDATKQVKIESYARHRVRGAILDGLRALDHASRDMRRKNKRAEAVYRSLEAKLGRPVSDPEMARAFGISLNQWYGTVRELQALGVEWLRPMSNVGTKAPAQLTLSADLHEDPLELCYRREKEEILNRALACLPERERLIMELYYERGLTMKQIGAKLGVDESRISQLQSTSLRRLRSTASAILRPTPPPNPSSAALPT